MTVNQTEAKRHTDPRAGRAFRRLFTGGDIEVSLKTDCNLHLVRRDSQKDHVDCLLERFCRKNLRGAWKTKSPCMAASRLNSGVRALDMPVLKGDPCVISAGYNFRNWSRSLCEIPGMRLLVMWLRSPASVLYWWGLMNAS